MFGLDTDRYDFYRAPAAGLIFVVLLVGAVLKYRGGTSVSKNWKISRKSKTEQNRNNRNDENSSIQEPIVNGKNNKFLNY